MHSDTGEVQNPLNNLGGSLNFNHLISKFYPPLPLLISDQSIRYFTNTWLTFLSGLFYRRNIDKSIEDLKNCEYDPVDSPLCPIFKLDKIESLARVDFDKMAYQVCYHYYQRFNWYFKGFMTKVGWIGKTWRILHFLIPSEWLLSATAIAFL